MATGSPTIRSELDDVKSFFLFLLSPRSKSKDCDLDFRKKKKNAVRALEIDGVLEIIRAFCTRGGNDCHAGVRTTFAFRILCMWMNCGGIDACSFLLTSP